MLSAGREVEWECCWCTALVGFHKLLVGGGETRWRNALKVPWRQRMAGHWWHSGTMLQLLSFSIRFHLHMSEKAIPPLLTHCDERSLLETLVLLHFKVVAFYKVEFLIKMSCFCVINCLLRLPRLARKLKRDSYLCVCRVPVILR